MENTVGLEKFIPRTRAAFALGIVFALGVLAATILAGMFFVRGLVREQIVRRDAEALHATTLMEQLDALELGTEDYRTDAQIGFDAAVRASRLAGVMGIRFYDTNGVFADSFPATIQPQPLGSAPLRAVAALRPYGRCRPDTPLSDVFIYRPEFATGRIAHVPTLEITVPLHRRDAKQFAGAAQFIVEGGGIAGEYGRLDRRLAQGAAGTFAVSGFLLATMLWPAFRRMERLGIDLAHRGERLRRANEELALAARSAAVGAVSAHLMHGLKNPLASLSQFVAGHGAVDKGPIEEEWQDALTASRRMQSLVEQTLEVLGDVRGEPSYEMKVGELVADVRRRVEAASARRQARLDIRTEGECLLASHTANLAGLILVNLMENAIEATPPGGTVELLASRAEEWLRFRVRDEGPGFPEHLRAQLFLPCRSTREGGSGIGLAISKRIADYLGARFELVESSARGCVFELALPWSVCQQPPR